mgnify:CR=1 FL=1|jgi:hypothetical protein
MKKTATYKEKLVYISYISDTYVLISYDENLTKVFKVDLNDLTDIKFDINKNT